MFIATYSMMVGRTVSWVAGGEVEKRESSARPPIDQRMLADALKKFKKLNETAILPHREFRDNSSSMWTHCYRQISSPDSP